MDSYFIYIAVAAATIASPGPGVVLSVSNAIRYGFWGALSGILGVATAMLGVAILSATSLAIILASSALAFTVLKYIGAAYLIYLGIKMWRASSRFETTSESNLKSNKQKFLEGFLITLLNPKPVFFFMALFPQFITPGESYLTEFVLLAVTFSVLVLVIHSGYAFFAKAAKSKLSTPKGSKLLCRISGSFYLFFGVGLASSK